jgi:hypothetical protein
MRLALCFAGFRSNALYKLVPVSSDDDGDGEQTCVGFNSFSITI